MTDIILESVRAFVLFGLVLFLVHIGRKRFSTISRSWNWVIAGFCLLLFGSLLDITDNFETLNRFVVIGDTEAEAFLEKVIGYLGGFVVLAVGLVRWIPEELAKRTQAEEALGESEERYRTLIESANVIAWEVELESWRFTYVSSHAVDLLGYELDEWYAEGFWADHIHSDDREQSVKFCKDSTERGKDHDFEYRMIAADGRSVWLRDIVTVVTEAARPVSLRGFMIDISQLKRTEDALRESENLLNSIFDNVPVGLLIKGPDHVVERANPTYQNWYGLQAEKMVGRRSDEVEDFQSIKEVEFMNAQEWEVLTTGKTLSRQVDRPFADGQIHNVNITKFPVYDQQGNITKVGSVSVDLTEQVQANQAKSKFLAVMSHDLRTPLNAILGYADILSHQYFGPLDAKKIQEYARDIYSGGEHLLSLVNDILDLSAIEAGKRSLVKENISAADVVMECERIIEEKVQFQGIGLVTEVRNDLPPLYADRRAAKQILLNLLSNSIKFTPEGGKITIRVTATNEHHTFEVSDTGIGIPADQIVTITDPFVRGHTDPHKSQEGTGLGLSIVKSLVDLQDGVLDIKSTVGKGTTITVTLPNGAP